MCTVRNMLHGLVNIDMCTVRNMHGGLVNIDIYIIIINLFIEGSLISAKALLCLRALYVYSKKHTRWVIKY